MRTDGGERREGTEGCGRREGTEGRGKCRTERRDKGTWELETDEEGQREMVTVGRGEGT